ncbi:D-alanyl-lipoteichoic acid biosynthesis protein DltD, partial [Staphylococcus pseudintermedius]
HHDYEPYYMSDAVHIGWRGWVEVTQQVHSRDVINLQHDRGDLQSF